MFLSRESRLVLEHLNIQRSLNPREGFFLDLVSKEKVKLSFKCIQNIKNHQKQNSNEKVMVLQNNFISFTIPNSS